MASQKISTSQNEAYERKTRQQHQKLLRDRKILQHSLITQKIVQLFNKKFCLRGALNARERGGENSKEPILKILNGRGLRGGMLKL